MPAGKGGHAKNRFATLRMVGAQGHAGVALRTVLSAAGVDHVVRIEDLRRALSPLGTGHFDPMLASVQRKKGSLARNP